MSPSNENAMAPEQRPLLDNSTRDASYQSTLNGSNIREPASAEPPPNKVSKADLRWIMVALFSAIFLASLDGTVVATLMTPIGSYFNKSYESSYIGSAYLLSVCCFTPLYGRLSDIFGRKGALILGLTLFGAGTILCAVAPSMNSLIAARGIAGMGGGGLVTVISIAMSDLVPLKERGVYQGYGNLIWTAGAGLGGPVGGFINDRFGWRAAFFVQLPIIAVSMILVIAKVDVKLPIKLDQAQTFREKLARIDWGGSIALVSCIASLLSALGFKSLWELPWTNSLVIGPLVASAVFLGLFILVEGYWAKEPVLPLRLMLKRTLLFVVISNFLFTFADYALIYNVALYISAVRLQSATNAGLHLMPFTAASAVGALSAGVIMRRTGKYWLLIIIAGLSAVVSTTLMSFWDTNTASYHLWLDILPWGLAVAAGGNGKLIALIASVSKEDLAVATGVAGLFRSLGSVMGVSLTGLLVQNILVPALAKRITGPGSAEIIDAIRHSTAVVPTLEPGLRQAAVESYQLASRGVFISQVVVCGIGLLACLPIQEFALPGTLEEQEAEERRREAGAAENNSD